MCRAIWSVSNCSFCSTVNRFAWSLLLAGWILIVEDPRVVRAQFGGNQTSFSKTLKGAEVVVLAEWIGVTPEGEGGEPGSTTALVRRVIKGRDVVGTGEFFQIPVCSSRQCGDQFLGLGNVNPFSGEVSWHDIADSSQFRIELASQFVFTPADSGNPLTFALGFLVSSEPQASLDAFLEFQDADFQDLVDLTPQFPRMKLRQWLRDPKTDPTRIGLYGLMLGMCGHAVDAKLLHEAIFERPISLHPVDEFLEPVFVGAIPAEVAAVILPSGKRDGDLGPEEDEKPKEFAAHNGEWQVIEFQLETSVALSRLMSGYLFCRGELGLKHIESRYIEHSSGDLAVDLAAIASLDFMWRHGANRIPRERLHQSIVLLLKREDLAAEAIRYLAEWDNWTAQDQVAALFGKTNVAIDNAVVAYLKTCASKALNGEALSPQAKRDAEIAQKHLNRISQDVANNTDSTE